MVGESSPSADATDEAYDDHLARSRRMWDRWSDYYGLSESDLEPMREAAIDRLALSPGDRVLDIGPGPGVNFERLRDDVGPEGTLVAVEYSPEMVEKARERVERHGWENIEVWQRDATTAEFEASFDAAIATLSMSVMPDVCGAVENVHRSLAPGAPFVVFDIRGVPEGPGRVVNPLLRRFLRWYANWNPDGDVLDSLSAVFGEVTVADTYFGGTTYTACCRKSADP